MKTLKDLNFYYKNIGNWNLKYRKYLDQYKIYTWQNIVSISSYKMGTHISFFDIGKWFYK